MGLFSKKQKQNKNKKGTKKVPKTKAKNKTTKQTTKQKSTTKNNKTTNTQKTTKKVPTGRTISTNDKYLSNTGSTKERTAVVVAVNKDNELGVVTLHSEGGPNKTRLKGYLQGDSYYRHFLEIEDNEKKPIKINEKFRENHKNMDVSKDNVEKILDHILYHTKQAKSNQEKLNKLNKKN